MITIDARCTREIKSSIAMTKAAFNKKTFHQQIGPKFKDETLKCYICRVAFYGAESWTLRKADQKYLESSVMWCCRRVEKINWIDRVKNEVLYRVKEERNILHTIKRRKSHWIGRIYVGTAF